MPMVAGLIPKDLWHFSTRFNVYTSKLFNFGIPKKLVYFRAVNVYKGSLSFKLANYP